MFRKVILALLVIINLLSMIPFYTGGNTDLFSINVLITAITAIISILYLIVPSTRSDLYCALITLIIAAIHAAMLIMRLYDVVYA